MTDHSNALLKNFIENSPVIGQVMDDVRPVQKYYTNKFEQAHTTSIPPIANALNFKEVRQRMSIFDYKDQITSLINRHQVVLITGETCMEENGIVVII